MTTVMVVEDNELSRDALARRLARRGYRVLLATDGEQHRVAAALEPARERIAAELIVFND